MCNFVYVSYLYIKPVRQWSFQACFHKCVPMDFFLCFFFFWCSSYYYLQNLMKPLNSEMSARRNPINPVKVLRKLHLCPPFPFWWSISTTFAAQSPTIFEMALKPKIYCLFLPTLLKKIVQTIYHIAMKDSHCQIYFV